MSVAGQLRMEPENGCWTVAKDGDDACLALFKRHYSHKPYRDGRKQKLFVGPGAKLVLVTPALNALFVWRKFKSDDGQAGVNCAVFRNESPWLASDLVLEAEGFAWVRWPLETRLYTYVNSRKIRPTSQPGRCFRKAGWSYVRTPDGKRRALTKWNRLHILEKVKLRVAPAAQEGQ